MHKCKYAGTGVWIGRCVGTKELDLCIGYEKCKNFRPNYLTNGDRIRQMNDEELAKWLEEIVPSNCDCCIHQLNCRFEHDTETVDYTEKYHCPDGILAWLKSPVKKENNDV